MLHRLPICALIFLAGIYCLLVSTRWSYDMLATSSLKEASHQQPSVSINDNADHLCEKYGWNATKSSTNDPTLPIYDFFIFSSEFDVLEIRLFELYDYVTLFLIAESPHTLTGQPKPLHLKENWSRFARYHPKIRRIEVPLVANISNPWENEYRMRREGLRLALESLSLTSPSLLLTSDADEIPKAEFMRSLHRCELSLPFQPFGLQCDFYYYSYEFKNQAAKWIGSTVTYLDASASKNISGEWLRRNRLSLSSIPQSCYHCSWCFSELKEVRFKMAAYSHTEHNQIQYRTREHILDRYRNGEDLFDREDQIYTFQENNQDLPQLLQSEPSRFKYMTTRFNTTNAGFIDV